MHHSRLPSSKSTLSYRLSAFDFATAFIAPILALYLRNLLTEPFRGMVEMTAELCDRVDVG
jgi:hypothetical protein